MLRKLSVWLSIATGMGSAVRLGKHVDQLFRYEVIQVLKEEGLFDYLQQPRTYGQILAEFGYIDTEYTKQLFDILSSDKENVILFENNMYSLNPKVPIPTLEEIVPNVDKRIRNFTHMAKGIAKYIPERLRQLPIEFSETFESDGRQLLTKFDTTLGAKIYTATRNSAFSLLTRQEREGLKGKKLLDVGCGSGRETAEIWLRYNGDIHITGIDPTIALLELADKEFPRMLDEMNPNHPPLNDTNRPVFENLNAMRLPYDDQSFDACFCGMVLHWTADPRQVIHEMIRVTKPGGFIFGSQPCKPAANAYLDLVIRTSENSYGFFWLEDFRRWFAEKGLELERVTPVNIYRAIKPI